LDEALARGLAEGVWTAAILVRLAEEHGVEMPISRAVAAILAGEADVDTALQALLARPLRAEADA
jgi:glycerol-3-phosphate dehydrogenase (NAD(P)+)